MAVYKVPQDVEAEDKLLGPLTLKQFIFLIVFILLGYVAFTLGQANPVLVLPFLPPMALFGYLAAPFTRDQPTDVYLGARLRFLFKPRRRVWDQSGMEELVRITVPKRVEVQLTNNLDQTEVRSRLNILASTIDSRGWATKNAYVNDPIDAGMAPGLTDSDRLVAPTSIPQTVPDNDITAADDMLDPSNNRVAYHMDQLAQQSASTVRQQAVEQMQQAASNPSAPTPVDALVESPIAAPPQPQRLATPYVPYSPSYSGVIEPVESPYLTPEVTGQPEPPVSSAQFDPYPKAMRQHILKPVHDSVSSLPDAPVSTQNQTTDDLPQSAKIGLAQRDDLSVEAIAHEADRVVHGDGDEVVINLH